MGGIRFANAVYITVTQLCILSISPLELELGLSLAPPHHRGPVLVEDFAQSRKSGIDQVGSWSGCLVGSNSAERLGPAGSTCNLHNSRPIALLTGDEPSCDSSINEDPGIALGLKKRKSFQLHAILKQEDEIYHLARKQKVDINPPRLILPFEDSDQSSSSMRPMVDQTLDARRIANGMFDF